MKASIVKALVTVLLVFVGAVGFAQDQGLAVSADKAVVDGSVASSEYGFLKDFGQLKLYLNRTQDTLNVAVVGNTKGWVAVGLGSRKMDSATIFMGFVSDGKTQFKIQQGVGHTHKDLDSNEVTASLLSFAMKEDGGKTTLEIALKADSYIKKDQATLDLIVAIGASDSFTAIHMYFNSLGVKIL